MVCKTNNDRSNCIVTTRADIFWSQYAARARFFYFLYFLHLVSPPFLHLLLMTTIKLHSLNHTIKLLAPYAARARFFYFLYFLHCVHHLILHGDSWKGIASFIFFGRNMGPHNKNGPAHKRARFFYFLYFLHCVHHLYIVFTTRTAHGPIGPASSNGPASFIFFTFFIVVIHWNLVYNWMGPLLLFSLLSSFGITSFHLINLNSNGVGVEEWLATNGAPMNLVGWLAMAEMVFYFLYFLYFLHLVSPPFI